MSLIVTSGKKFLDIDAFAGCIAYAELLKLQGIEAKAVSTAVMNESITRTARELGGDLLTGYAPTDDDTFVIIDVSEPDFLDRVVDPAKIVSVIDHHIGFEAYWQKRQIEDIDIELIGAACTQVYERWKQAGLIDSISPASARLLSLGILDNTLHFTAKVCTQRDIDAYQHLALLGNVPLDWAEHYFQECQESIVTNLSLALENDTKQMDFPGYDGILKVGQLVVWDANGIVDDVANIVEDRLHVVNLVSIKDNTSYLLAHDLSIQRFLKDILAVHFEGTKATANRMWLRKEIMKAAIDASSREMI